MANRSIDWIRYQKEKDPKKPILLTLNFPAPHGPEDAAQKYQGVFNNTATQRVTRTQDKNYNNIEHNPSKNWLLSQISSKLTPETEKFGDLLYQKRLQVRKRGANRDFLPLKVRLFRFIKLFILQYYKMYKVRGKMYKLQNNSSKVQAKEINF